MAQGKRTKQETKDAALKMIENGSSKAKVAAKFKVSESTIYSWVTQAKKAGKVKPAKAKIDRVHLEPSRAEWQGGKAQAVSELTESLSIEGLGRGDKQNLGLQERLTLLKEIKKYREKCNALSELYIRSQISLAAVEEDLLQIKSNMGLVGNT